MSPLAALFTLFILLLLLGCPIAAALGGSSLAVLLIFGLASLDLIPHLLFGSVHSFTLLPIPLFILAGGILAESRVSRQLVMASSRLFGRRRGGLAYVMITGGIFLAGISGSGPADVAVLASLMREPMEEQGYPRPLIAALAAACGGIGIIVPPSIALIIFGVVAETDISALFLAGVIPGLVVGLFLAAGAWWSMRGLDSSPETPAPVQDASSSRETGGRKGAAWGAGFPLIILGGIYSGWFTPTESAAVAVLYAIIVGRVVFPDLQRGQLLRILADSARTSAGVMAIVATASLFSWIITTQGLASGIAGRLSEGGSSPLIILLLANLVILGAGCFMDAISVYYVFVPLLMPAVREAGIDPVHFGVVTTVNLAVGQVTPPIGINLFVASGITGVSIGKMIKAGWPFLVCLLAALALINLIPELSLWLPEMAAGR